MSLTYRQQVIQPIYAEIDYNTSSIGTGVLIGAIPMGAKILNAHIYVETAFNASGTDLFRLGFNAGDGQYAMDLDVSSVGTQDLSSYVYALNPLAAPRNVYARYVGGGTPASAGKLHVVFEYSL